MPNTSQSKPITEWASYWFVELEKHIETGDLGKAAEAQSELLRLGYDVSITEGASK